MPSTLIHGKIPIVLRPYSFLKLETNNSFNN